MIDGATLALALGAGVVAALNPCGFVLLPAYLSLLVIDEQPSRPVAVTRALRATAAMTAGFAAVFALFGLAVAPVASSVQQYLPAFTIVLGIALALAGAWVLAGRSITVPRFGRRGTAARPLTASIASMAGFGASYAIASLGCTIAPFLAVVVTAFRAGSIGEGLLDLPHLRPRHGLGCRHRVRRGSAGAHRTHRAAADARRCADPGRRCPPAGGRRLRRLVRSLGAEGVPHRRRIRPGRGRRW